MWGLLCRLQMYSPLPRVVLLSRLEWVNLELALLNESEDPVA